MELLARLEKEKRTAHRSNKDTGVQQLVAVI